MSRKILGLVAFVAVLFTGVPVGAEDVAMVSRDALDPNWQGTLEQRELLKGRFAKRWAYFALASKHELREALEVSDWETWEKSGLIPLVSIQELQAIRQDLSPEELEAFAIVDDVINRAWIQPLELSESHYCYELAVLGELANRTEQVVNDHWTVASTSSGERDESTRRNK